VNINDALKNDIAHVGDMVLTPSGDLGQISGLANLKRALFHRLITIPGTLVHRPTYGIGIGLYQNGLSSFSKQAELASKIAEQFAQDPRVLSVKSVSVNFNNSNPQQTLIGVFVTPIGYTEQQMTFTPFVS